MHDDDDACDVVIVRLKLNTYTDYNTLSTVLNVVCVCSIKLALAGCGILCAGEALCIPNIWSANKRQL